MILGTLLGYLRVRSCPRISPQFKLKLSTREVAKGIVCWPVDGVWEVTDEYEIRSASTRDRMAKSEHALPDEVGESPASTSYGAFRAESPVVPALTGDERGETPFSEYSLNFKMTLVRRGSRIGGGRTTVSVAYLGVGLTGHWRQWALTRVETTSQSWIRL